MDAVEIYRSGYRYRRRKKITACVYGLTSRDFLPYLIRSVKKCLIHSRVYVVSKSVLYVQCSAGKCLCRRHKPRLFVSTRYKCLWCPIGVQHDWQQCIYAHNYMDVRSSGGGAIPGGSGSADAPSMKCDSANISNMISPLATTQILKENNCTCRRLVKESSDLSSPREGPPRPEDRLRPAAMPALGQAELRHRVTAAVGAGAPGLGGQRLVDTIVNKILF